MIEFGEQLQDQDRQNERTAIAQVSPFSLDDDWFLYIFWNWKSFFGICLLPIFAVT